MKKILISIILLCITILNGCSSLQLPVFEQKTFPNSKKSICIIPFIDTRKTDNSSNNGEEFSCTYATEVIHNVFKYSDAFTKVDILEDSINQENYDFILIPKLKRMDYSENMTFYTIFWPLVYISGGVVVLTTAGGEAAPYLGWSLIGYGLLDFLFKTAINKNSYNHTLSWEVNYQLIDVKSKQLIKENNIIDSYSIIYSHRGMSDFPVATSYQGPYRVDYYEKYENDPMKIKLYLKDYVIYEFSQKIAEDIVSLIK